MPRLRSILAFVIATSACSLVTGVDGLREGGDDEPLPDAPDGARPFEPREGDGAAVEDAGAPESGPSCPSGRGPEMIAVPVGQAHYCIDRTEVSQAQYEVFLRSKNGDVTRQIAECTGNSTYGNFATDCRFDPKTRGDKPVGCVDWCDAVAFCAWSGKTLCGALDGGALPGGPADTEGKLKSGESAWMRACSRGPDGVHAFPYGATEDPTACTAKGSDAGDVTNVGSRPRCEGGYPGLFDMSGNVHEWENSCDDGGSCALRGGDINVDDARCDEVFGFARTGQFPYIGFRCCTPLVTP